MTNPPENPAGPPQRPGPPPGWQHPPPDHPVWQGHRAPQQSAAGWQPQPPRKSRTGLIVGIVMAVLLLGGGAVTAGVLFLTGDDPDVLAVSELEEGMCLSSSDLAGSSRQVDDLKETDCSGAHDAEVFAVLEAQDGESLGEAGMRCAAELGDDFDALSEESVEVRPLAARSELAAGDRVVCFLRSENGAPLTEELV